MPKNAETHEPEVELRDYLRIIVKRRWVIISFFAIVVTIVTIGSFKANPVYRATTQILIEKESPRVLSFEEVYAMRASETDYYQTQYKLLKSRSLAEEVYQNLDLKKYPAPPEPEFSLQSLLKKWLPQSSSKEESQGDPLRELLNAVHIEPVRNSRLVNIHVEGYYPQKAADIANVWAGTYIDQSLKMKLDASQYAVEWLSEQLKGLKEKVKKAEVDLVEYKEKHNIQLVSTVGPFGESSVLKMLEEKRAELELEISGLSKRYKSKHPKMVRLYSELKSVEEKIEKQAQKSLNLGRQAIQYRVLKREAESSKEMYNVLLKRMKETTLTGGLESSNIRVVDKAEVPKYPIKPKKKLNVALAMVVGITVGTGLAFFFEYLDNTIKTPEDMERYIRLPFLGSVPSARSVVKGLMRTDLVSYDEPKSNVAEAYRTIRTGITFSSAVDKDKSVKSIMVTSAGPLEGKTTHAINLAITMANAGDKVLLVDGDMRRPRIHRTFELDNTQGLTDFLVGKVDLDAIARDTQIPNLSVVVSGPIPPNPAELIGSDKMKEFLRVAMDRFGRVLFDSPPIVPVTDAVVLASMVDGVVQIIRAEKTSRDLVLEGKQRLRDVNARILGTVLNNLRVGRGSYYYYHSYSYDQGGRRARRKHETGNLEAQQVSEFTPSKSEV